MKNRKVGVIGGMGPYATFEFCKKILDLSPVKDQSEHIRLCIDMNSSIPSRTKAVFEGGESPVPEIIHMVNTLTLQGVDMIVMPCNNATYFLPAILEVTDVHFVSIIETTVAALDKATVKRVAVLGTYITFYKRTYKEYIEANGFIYVEYGDSLFHQVEKAIQLIRDFGVSTRANNLVQHVIDKLITLNIDSLILGCTELSLVNININQKKIQIVDSSLELAKYVVSCYFSN